jgi:hypothetical protein
MSVIDWDEVDSGLVGAKAITWDTCHKIYVLMDDEQVAETRGYGYGDEPDSFYTCDEMSHNEMLEKLKEWFEKSCALKFIQAVETNHTDPNAGYTSLIEQGAKDYEECEDCYDPTCRGVCADYDEEEDEDEDEDEEDEE